MTARYCPWAEECRRAGVRARALAWLAGAAFCFMLGVGTAGIVRAQELAAAGAFRIIDGDTAALGDEVIRIENIDAPELHGRCAAESVVAGAARERLRKLLEGPVDVRRTGRDRYGRTLARLATAQGDVGTILVGEGLALPWRPGSEAWLERARHWCGRRK